MTWAVACFGPFAGARSNASEIVQRRLVAEGSTGRFAFVPPLPVTFGGAWPALRAFVDARPELEGVVCLGQAAGRRLVDLERVALNYVDAEVADNDGVRPALGPIDAGGPPVRWSTIPWDRFAAPAGCGRSYSAGTFVCNALFYDALGWAERAGKMAGFVHVPALDSQPEFAAFAPAREDDVVARVADALAFLGRL